MQRLMRGRSSGRGAVRLTLVVVATIMLVSLALVQAESMTVEADAATVDDTSRKIGWSRQWVARADPGAFGGTERVTDAQDAKAMLQFRGSSVTLYFTRDHDRAKAKVTIDGKMQPTIDQFGPLAYRQSVTYRMAPGWHTLVVYHAGERNPQSHGWRIGVDAFAVDGTLGAPAPVATSTPTRVASTATATRMPATATHVLSTATATRMPMTATATQKPPTATSVPATSTSTRVPATATHVHPTATATQPRPTMTATVAPPAGTTQPVAGQLCPQWYHDQITTTGPDGKQYPTWHPAVDPATGCLFGHEHGVDPRTSKANPTMPAFGYAAAQMGMVEPHVGFKVQVMNAGFVADDGRVVTADYRIVFHMGTSGVKRFTERFHSVQYDYVARDGTGREAHINGMADTTDNPIGSTCTTPRGGGRDFSTIGCNDPYEIWAFFFKLHHPDDAYDDPQHVRAYLSGSIAAFDPVTTVDPSDLTRLVFSQDYHLPGSGVDPKSPNADFLGCQREFYGGPNFWNNAGGPQVYYTDAMGHVQPGPGPGLIRQEISASVSRTNEIYKHRQDTCGGGIRWPN